MNAVRALLPRMAMYLGLQTPSKLYQTDIFFPVRETLATGEAFGPPYNKISPTSSGLSSLLLKV